MADTRLSTLPARPYTALVPPWGSDEEWLEVRARMLANGAVSASEASKVMGESRYGDASTLVAPEPVVPTFPMRAGLAMEAAILAFTEAEHGLTIRRNMPRLAGCVRSPDLHWLVASPDAVVVDETGRWTAAIDAKFVHGGTSDRTLLREYGRQVQQQAYVLGVEGGYITALKGNDELSLIEVEVDHRRFEREVLPYLRKLHEVRTLARPFDPNDYPFGWGSFGTTTATPGKRTTVSGVLVERVRRAKQRVLREEQRHDTLANELRAVLGDAEEGIDRRGRVLVTYRAHERTTLDTKRLRHEHPAIAEAYESVTPYRQLLVRARPAD